jgi:heme-degrading monooxygenase HmoA
VLVIVWEYEVSPQRTADFESFYAADGPWSTLFREAPGFVSVTLMRDARTPGRYMVADRWVSETSYEEFKRAHAEDYASLSARGKALYARETEVGRFDFVD